MSEQSKALVRRSLEEVFAEGNFDAIPEIFAPDYVEHDPASDGEIRGHDGLRRDLEPYVNAFSDTRVTVEDQLAEGDLVATRVTVRATHVEQFRGVPPTGERIEVTGTVVHRVAGGRLAEGWWNWDTLGLMQQLGAIPAEQPA
jgi:steroid delta-isomerase-like uncharacterized protein